MHQRNQIMHTTILPTVKCLILSPYTPLDSCIYLFAGYFHLDVLQEPQTQHIQISLQSSIKPSFLEKRAWGKSYLPALSLPRVQSQGGPREAQEGNSWKEGERGQVGPLPSWSPVHSQFQLLLDTKGHLLGGPGTTAPWNSLLWRERRKEFSFLSSRLSHLLSLMDLFAQWALHSPALLGYIIQLLFFFLLSLGGSAGAGPGRASGRAGWLTASGRTQASERAADIRLSSRLRLFLLQLTQHSSSVALGPRRRPPHDRLRARGMLALLCPPSWGGFSRPLPAVFPALFRQRLGKPDSTTAAAGFVARVTACRPPRAVSSSCSL